MHTFMRANQCYACMTVTTHICDECMPLNANGACMSEGIDKDRSYVTEPRHTGNVAKEINVNLCQLTRSLIAFRNSMTM